MNDLKERLTSAVIVGLLFAVVGTLLPSVYYKYFDNRLYYSVQQPVDVEKEVYAPCEILGINLVRTSEIETVAVSVHELIMVREDGSIAKRFLSTRENITIPKSENRKVFIEDVVIPCDTVPGEYFLQATMTYKYKEIEKTYHWSTELFTVEE